MTLVIESNNGAATAADAVQWANDYGLTFPVLADPSNTGWNYIGTGNTGGSYGLPNAQLLSPGLKVEKVNGAGGFSESDFLPFLEEE